VLVVDDDSEDILLTMEALKEVAPRVRFKSVKDGDELIDYLAVAMSAGKGSSKPFPELIFLDLNMPGKSGFEVLDAIRGDPVLKRIPIVILSTSTMEVDINRSFDMGANSFISKPQTYDELLTVMSRAVEYWFGVNSLPSILTG
jgi:CheY-like chemotaxis protein